MGKKVEDDNPQPDLRLEGLGSPDLAAAAENADAWSALVKAADAGDEKAQAFLLTFEPWVVDQLRGVKKS